MSMSLCGFLCVNIFVCMFTYLCLCSCVCVCVHVEDKRWSQLSSSVTQSLFTEAGSLVKLRTCQVWLLLYLAVCSEVIVTSVSWGLGLRSVAMPGVVSRHAWTPTPVLMLIWQTLYPLNHPQPNHPHLRTLKKKNSFFPSTKLYCAPSKSQILAPWKWTCPTLSCSVFLKKWATTSHCNGI